jgi:hypothetical protein
VPALCTTFDRVYVEDWSKPSHLADSHQVRPLVSSSTQLPEGRLAELEARLMTMMPSLLFRNVAAGFAIKSGLMEGSSAAMFTHLVTMSRGRPGSVSSVNHKEEAERAAFMALMAWEQDHVVKRRTDHMKWRRREITMKGQGFEENKPLV